MRRLCENALSAYQNRTQSLRLRHPARLKCLYRLDSLDSARVRIAQGRSWLIPVHSLLPWQQTWSNGEHRGVGSRPAGATLYWKEEPQQAALTITAVSDISKPCAAWPIYRTHTSTSLCFKSTCVILTVSLLLLRTTGQQLPVSCNSPRFQYSSFLRYRKERRFPAREASDKSHLLWEQNQLREIVEEIHCERNEARRD